MNQSVAWLKVDTQTILTIHNHVITKNNRIGIFHTQSNVWQLHIKDVKESDYGWYMCQINTDPMKSQRGYLNVVGNIIQRRKSLTFPDDVKFACNTESGNVLFLRITFFIIY
ncbi:hypothetical protein NQ315_002860 [Exocentrus adspersus]|uniref:Immunoglobulin-like beta-sandwich domain-containing protein n=1 Tax=Exocentrus adspersus TaxID=1586481 RepID=A0AAV8V914_9CUCU|nr:hypothetical protein NQ315_002860 [Exocentrus adspersus]